MPVLPVTPPDVLSYDGNVYIAIDVQYESIGSDSVSAEFNVSTSGTGDEALEYPVYSDEVTEGEFVRLDTESPLLSGILDQLEEEFGSTNMLCRIGVYPLSLFVEFYANEMGDETAQEILERLTNKALMNLKHGTVVSVKRTDVEPF